MSEVTVKPASKSTQVGEGDSRMIVIDIGKKQKKKAIRRLRQGRGRLTAKVEEAVKEIREEAGTGPAPVIVVVVRRKKKCGRTLW